MKNEVAMPSESKDKKDEMDEYELENHARTLMDAEKLMADKELHGKVKKHMKTKGKKYLSLAGMRKLANTKKQQEMQESDD